MDYRLKTLTPIWTAGANGKVDRVHETGIIGSLRWWFEVLVRGVGGQACDPTDHECLYDPNKPNNVICSVCKVFGTTGWRRRFRLSVEETDMSDATISPLIEASRLYTNRKGNPISPAWYFRDPTRENVRHQPANTPKQGTLTIRIQSLFRDFRTESIISGLIQFICDWAALGARTQMGFGVVQLETGRIDTLSLYDHLMAVAGDRTYTHLPSLKNLFLACIQKDGIGEKETFNLKYDLRRCFSSDSNLRHFIMGTIKGQRIAAKVKMSRSYGDGLMRVWGWVPEEASVYGDSWDRDKVVDAIYQYLINHYTLKTWREMNSTRDTELPNCKDALQFLRSLLRPGGENDAI